VIFIVLTFVAVGLLRVSLPLTLLVLVPLGIGAAWWVRR
jgi:hypothetical protein